MLSFLCESFFCVDDILFRTAFVESAVYVTLFGHSKKLFGPAVHVILVETGVTVSLSVRNCPSILCLSVSLMSGLNGE